MNRFRLMYTQWTSLRFFLCTLLCLLVTTYRSLAAPTPQSVVEPTTFRFADDFSTPTSSNHYWKVYEDSARAVNGVYSIEYREWQRITHIMGPYVQEELLDMDGPLSISFDLRPIEYNADDHLVLALHSWDDLRYYIAAKIYFDGRYELGRWRQHFISGQAETPLFTKNMTSHVQVEVNRYAYSVTINGAKLFSYPRLSPFVGKIGLGWSKEGGDPLHFSIDNVQIESLVQEQSVDELGIPLLLPGDMAESSISKTQAPTDTNTITTMLN